MSDDEYTEQTRGLITGQENAIRFIENRRDKACPAAGARKEECLEMFAVQLQMRALLVAELKLQLKALTFPLLDRPNHFVVAQKWNVLNDQANENWELLSAMFPLPNK